MRPCIAACGQGDARACRRAGEFVWTDLAGPDDMPDGYDPYEDAMRYQERGCTLGDQRACARHAEYLLADQPAAARPRAESACEAGIAQGCHVLAQLDGFDAKGRPMLERAEKLYAEACNRGEGEACMDLAGLHGAFQGFWGHEAPPPLSHDDELIVKWLRAAVTATEAACAAGDALECLRRVWIYQQHQLGSRRRIPGSGSSALAHWSRPNPAAGKETGPRYTRCTSFRSTRHILNRALRCSSSRLPARPLGTARD